MKYINNLINQILKMYNHLNLSSYYSTYTVTTHPDHIKISFSGKDSFSELDDFVEAINGVLSEYPDKTFQLLTTLESTNSSQAISLHRGMFINQQSFDADSDV
jgi:ABC-type Fe2+-enterobactin transport system substrate-binding protein